MAHIDVYVCRKIRLATDITFTRNEKLLTKRNSFDKTWKELNGHWYYYYKDFYLQ